MGRGQRPRTPPSVRTNEDKENNKDYPGSDKYEDKYKEGTDDAIMGEEAPLPDL